MNSTSISKNSLIKISDLNLVFNFDYYKRSGIRDVFVDLVKNPMNYLFKEKDRFQTLKDINLEIFEGDRIGLIGLNGAGKTSLCRCISGMYFPESGKIERNVEVNAIFNAGLGIMPELTGRENALLLLRLLYGQRLNPKEVVDEVLDFSELGHFAEAPFRTYSKGMQTRLFLSVVFYKSSEFIILDEVFDGADVHFRRKINQRIMQVLNETKAFILVSHSEEQISEVCNRVVIINDHKIFYDGSVEMGLSIYNDIANSRARGEGI